MKRWRALAVLAVFAALPACSHGVATRVNAAVSRPPRGLPAAPLAPSWSAAELRALRAQLGAAFGSTPYGTSGIAIVDADARPLYTKRERAPMTPASTFKCLVAVASLATFGPEHRFETTFEAVDDPRDGRIDGNVYLVGGGDPSLTGDDLRGAAGALARSGARDISGDIVVDASAFSGPEVNPAWDPDDLQYGYAAGTSAISVDGGTVDFKVLGTTPGAPAKILAQPANDAVRISGTVTTGYSTDLSIERAPDANTFAFSGRVASGAEPEFWRPVVDQPTYAGGIARAALRAHEVAVEGGVRTGVAPVAAIPLWRHRSAPLRQIVKRMLFVSDNHIAETLLRDLGTTHGAGTERLGEAVERAVFRREDVSAAGLRVVDGSGLAASDRIAPLALASLLARAAQEPFGPVLVDALPRVGIEGTVKYHGVTDARGRARAKSGHIGGVNALAGYVQTAHHGRVAFAILVNGPGADGADGGIDRALDVLARS